MLNEQAVKWARRQTTKGLAAKAILQILASYADGDGRCFPALRTIADDGCTDTKSVRRQLKSLEAAGLIAWERGGSHKANTYTLALHVNPVPEEPEADSWSGSPRDDDSDAPNSGAERPQSESVERTPSGAQRPQRDPALWAERPQSDEALSGPLWALRPRSAQITEALCGRSAHKFGGGAPTEELTTSSSVGKSRARGSRELAEALNATSRSTEVAKLVKRWAEGHDKPLPRTTYDLLARQVQMLRDRGGRPAHVWAALREWDEKQAAGEKPKPGLLPYLHDQIKLDGLTASQMYATPVDYLRDEDIDVFEVLGYDPVQVEAPPEIENGPMDARRAWYDQARAERHKVRCGEARERIARRQQLQLLPRPA